jgi:membrane-bound lytic murein transglycosylase D
MKRFNIIISAVATGLFLTPLLMAAPNNPIGDKVLHTGNTPETFDSILAKWYSSNIVKSYDEFFQDFIDIDSVAVPQSNIPDSVYENRMKMLISPIALGYNDIIKKYIITYTTSRKAMMGRILGLSQMYFPMIEEELARLNLPLELRMLPIVESALNPIAVSRAGATGLWQFMYNTGKIYGLEITSFVDQRRDPLLSTKAACRYLKDLYAMYGDWTLAIASYNCGPGNVNKALKRAGDDAKTFWDIYPYLPRETRGYVPSLVAAMYAYTFHQQHGIEFVSPPLPIATDTIMVSRLMHLEQVASTLDISMDVLRQLNPQYKNDIIPALDKKYAFTLPQHDISRYIENEAQILGKDTIYLADYMKKPTVALEKEFNISSVRYKVKSGDTLGSIARKHGVTVKQIVKWNNIKNANKLRLGQTLEIFK